jgi:hypothetical protein
MSSEVREQILRMIEGSHARPSAAAFEMAYQARVATDRIRFAIKHIEQFGVSADQLREVGLQLLDALQRLDGVDRRFQEWSQTSLGSRISATNPPEGVNGHRGKATHQRTNGTSPGGNPK